MGRQAWRTKAAVTLLGAALAVLGGFVPDGASAGGQDSGGPPDPGGPNVVLSGSYSCTIAVSTLYVAPGEPPITYSELIDSVSMSSTGGIDPAHAGSSPASPPVIGPGFGGRGPISGVPRVGGTAPITGFGTGHSFEGGTIEDCVRFAQAMAQMSTGLGCTASDVRRRQPPGVPSIIVPSPSASFSFVCEGPAPAIVHLMGDLNRAVLGLRIQPAP